MKFNKKSEAYLRELVKRYKLATTSNVLLDARVKELLADMEKAIPLLKDYLAFSQTKPFSKGDAVMNKKGTAYIVKHLIYEFDEKGNPFWEKISAKGLQSLNEDLDIVDVLPYNNKGRILFQNEEGES